MKGKSIIFAAPLHFGFNEIIKNELIACGFDVIDISVFSPKFKYKNFFERVKSFIIKNFGGNNQYKLTLQFNRHRTSIFKKLETISYKADFAFIIRPDFFPSHDLQKILSRANKSIGYQWDGLQRFPKVYDTIKYFDIFYVFDHKDLKLEGTKITSNFYPEAIPLKNSVPLSDIYYAGSYNKNRIKELEQIIEYANALNLNVDYTLFSRKMSDRHKSKLNITNIASDYYTNLEHVVSTKILIDVVNPSHEGLSFRTFESIGFRKKLITTNKSISQYDFYNSNNILIWDELKTADDLKNFIAIPYEDLDENIRLKYGFRNWIKYMLDEPPYIELK